MSRTQAHKVYHVRVLHGVHTDKHNTVAGHGHGRGRGRVRVPLPVRWCVPHTVRCGACVRACVRACCLTRSMYFISSSNVRSSVLTSSFCFVELNTNGRTHAQGVGARSRSARTSILQYCKPFPSAFSQSNTARYGQRRTHHVAANKIAA